MGYNYKYGNSNYTSTTPSMWDVHEDPILKEARLNNARQIDRLKPPTMIGSEKQINWAIRLFGKEQFFWHGHGYKFEDIVLFLESPEARSASWWITTCKDNHNGMGGNMRVALDVILDRIKQRPPTRAALSLKLKVGYPDPIANPIASLFHAHAQQLAKK